jgi:hypothetical protein
MISSTIELINILEPTNPGPLRTRGAALTGRRAEESYVDVDHARVDANIV